MAYPTADYTVRAVVGRRADCEAAGTYDLVVVATKDALPGWSAEDADVRVRGGRVTVRLRPPGIYEGLAERMWDPEHGVVACRRHHGLMDSRLVRIHRSDLPERVERWAHTYALEWMVDRDYGAA